MKDKKFDKGDFAMYHISKNDKPDIGYMVNTLSKLMSRGVRLADCKKMRDYYSNMRDILKSDFTAKYGVQNPNSSQQLTSYIKRISEQVALDSKNDIINICFDDSTGKWTSNAEAMEKLADLGYEFAMDLLDYRHAKKYAEAIEGVMVAADENGLVHPTVSLGKTNRVNYSNPGLMSLPKQLLWNIVAPYTEGNVLYSVDIKNQEPSILINMTGATELKYALESPEGLYETMFKQCFCPKAVANVLIDTLAENRVYKTSELKAMGTISPAMYSAAKAQNASMFYNGKRVVAIEIICVGSEKGLKPELPDKVCIELEDGSIDYAEVEWENFDKNIKRSNDYKVYGALKGIDINISKIERSEFKRSYLAFTYGASAFGIKEMCKKIDGGQVYNYLSNISAIKEYRSAIDKHIKAGNTTICTIFGNRLYAGDDYDEKRLKRVMLDLPIQGSAADILSLLIKHFYEYTDKNGLSDKLSLYYTRHDELIIEVNGDWLKEVGASHVESVLRDMLEHQIDDWTPFKIEVEQVKSNTDIKIEE